MTTDMTTSYGITPEVQDAITATLAGLAPTSESKPRYSKDIRAAVSRNTLTITWWAGEQGEGSPIVDRETEYCRILGGVAYSRDVAIPRPIADAISAARAAMTCVAWRDAGYTNTYRKDGDYEVSYKSYARLRQGMHDYIGMLIREIALEAIRRDPLPVPFDPAWLTACTY